MERHGYHSVVAERIRENYQARVQARELAQQEKATGRDAGGAEPASEGPGSKSRSLADIQKESVENWVRLRRSQGYNPGQSDGQSENAKDIQRESAEAWLRHRNGHGQAQDHAEPTPALKTGRGRDDDLAL
jgi:hypothetical protein